jgi:hypothetical protein
MQVKIRNKKSVDFAGKLTNTFVHFKIKKQNNDNNTQTNYTDL